MKGQSSVGKRIIWALFMVVLCTFLTFFMSMFLGSAFPELNVIYKAGIPVLVFVVLGVASLGLQSFLIPFVNSFSVPKGVKIALPIVLIGLGMLLGQFSYDEYADAALGTDVFQKFILDGSIYEAGEFSYQGIYQSGLDVVSILLGRTVFAVSFYNRIYLVLIALLGYFALKNICGKKTLASNLFLVFFFCAKQTMELSVMPEASLVYVLLVALFLFSVSLVYYYRTKTTKLMAQVISVFIMGCLFAALFISETNSLIFAIPAILVSFSGKHIQDKRWYYILAVEGMLLILITCMVVFALKPEIVLDFGFELPAINAVDLKVTALLILNVLGFLGVYGMWNQKLYYIIPALMSIYYMFVKTEFVSGVNGELCGFLCFVLYAALGIGLLDNFELVEEEEEEEEEDELEEDEPIAPIAPMTPMAPSVPIAPSVPMAQESALTAKAEPVRTDDTEQKEIDSIKAMNEKLNQVEAGFVPLTFKKPKRQEKKTYDYAYEPTVEEMKYDIEVSDDDDFDI